MKEKLDLKHVLNSGRYVNSAPGPHDSVTAFSGSWPSTWATTWPVHLSLHHSSLFLALSASGPSLPSLALLFSVPQLNQNGKAEDRLGGTLRSNPKPPLMFITSLTCRHLTVQLCSRWTAAWTSNQTQSLARRLSRQAEVGGRQLLCSFPSSKFPAEGCSS